MIIHVDAKNPTCSDPASCFCFLRLLQLFQPSIVSCLSQAYHLLLVSARSSAFAPLSFVLFEYSISRATEYYSSGAAPSYPKRRLIRASSTSSSCNEQSPASVC
jgi:hypothetical protein